MKTAFLLLISSACFFRVSPAFSNPLSLTGSSEQVFMQLAEDKWGEANVRMPTPFTWIEYEEDLGQRFCIDFETGTCEIEVLLREDVAPGNMSTRIITGKDGISRKVVTLRFNLASDHLSMRARQYYSIAREYAQKYGHDPALIMAVIHNKIPANGQPHGSRKSICPTAGLRPQQTNPGLCKKSTYPYEFSPCFSLYIT